MKSKDSIIKRVLKKLRAAVWINIPIRVLVKIKINCGKSIFNFFSIHWPVTGAVKFKLPQNETVKIFSKGDDYVSTQAFWKGYMGYEGPSVQLFYHLSKKCGAIVDIGANVGYYTLIGASSNLNAKVYSFEPVKVIYERLCKNINLNALSNVVAENCLVGNSESPVKFYLPRVKGIPSAASAKQGWNDDAEEIIVPSVTLDSYKKSRSISSIKLIKMDCEFHEKEVLEGMSAILKDDKPVIIMEVLFAEGEGTKGHIAENVHKEIERIMKDNNYYFYLINNMALIRLDKLEYNPDERNYLFSTKCSDKIYNAYSDMDGLITTIL